MSYLNVSLFIKLIYSACVYVCKCVNASAHKLYFLPFHPNSFGKIQWEKCNRNGKHSLTHTHKENTQKKIGKKQTDKRNLLVHHTSILLVLLKSAFCFAFFCCGIRWSCCWKHAFLIVSLSIIRSNNTPNYLLKLPLYRHCFLAFFARKTQMLKIIWR